MVPSINCICAQLQGRHTFQPRQYSTDNATDNATEDGAAAGEEWEHGRKRSSAGYLQDLTPTQLAAVVAAEAGSGMRIMV
jgi:hypothetical protein